MHTFHKTGISRASTIGIIVVIVIIIVAAAVLLRPPASSSKASSTTTVPSSLTTTSLSTAPSQLSSSSTSSIVTSTPTKSSFQLSPPNKSVLVDDSWYTGMDALDPAVGFVVADEAVFNNVFQQLVEFNGPNYTQVVPVLASSFTVLNNSQTYEFQIRSNVTFSSGDPLNAYAVWFSYVRTVYLGQGIASANYALLTFNTTEQSQTGVFFPWGIRAAIQSATGLPALSNATLAKNILNNMLSNFNPSNSTQLAIMSYQDQAYAVSGPMTFEVHLLEPYKWFLTDIAQWWGAIVDPTFVDAHGGVQANTLNNYFDANSGPGTGPYELRSIATGFSQIVLQPNPTYWGKYAQNVPTVAQPPHIPIVEVNFGLPAFEVIQAFDKGLAQIAYADVSQFNQIYDGYQWKQYYSFNDIFHNYGLISSDFVVSMNTQKYPTNNTDFRLAIVHAVNYTQELLSTLSFNGTVYGTNFLGPINPAFPQYYNPDNLSLYSTNYNLAAYYLNLAGEQEDFSVTLPNGTVIGNTSAPPLPPLTINYLTPENLASLTQLEIIQAGLSKIGLSVGLQGITASVFLTWTNPQVSGNFMQFSWGPDWPDPILQEAYQILTNSAFLPAWVNLPNVNQMFLTLPFDTNITQQRQDVAELYNITYNYAPYIWQPATDLWLFVQPYVAGMIYNLYPTPAVTYWYNTIYYNSTS